MRFLCAPESIWVENKKRSLLKSEKIFELHFVLLLQQPVVIMTEWRGARKSYELFTRNIPIVSLLFIINLNFRAFFSALRFFWIHRDIKANEGALNHSREPSSSCYCCFTVASCTKRNIPFRSRWVSGVQLFRMRWIPFPCIFPSFFRARCAASCTLYHFTFHGKRASN